MVGFKYALTYHNVELLLPERGTYVDTLHIKQFIELTMSCDSQHVPDMFRPNILENVVAKSPGLSHKSLTQFTLRCLLQIPKNPIIRSGKPKDETFPCSEIGPNALPQPVIVLILCCFFSCL